MNLTNINKGYPIKNKESFGIKQDDNFDFNSSFEVYYGRDSKFDLDKYIEDLRITDEGIQRNINDLFDITHPSCIFRIMITCIDSQGHIYQGKVSILSWIHGTFLDKDILDNIYKSGNIDLLDVRYDFPYFIDVSPKTESFIIDKIRQNKKLTEIILYNYNKIQKSKLELYLKKTEKIKALLEVRNKLFYAMNYYDFPNSFHDTKRLDIDNPRQLKTEIDRSHIYGNENMSFLRQYERDLFSVLEKEYDPENFDIFSIHKNLEKNKEGDIMIDNLNNIIATIKNIHHQKEMFKKEIINKVNFFNKNPNNGILELDSKYLFFENGSNLYENILHNSEYTEYYKGELKNIDESFYKIKKYCNENFLDLGCGIGEKDEIFINNYIKNGFKNGNFFLFDSSIASLKNCFHRLEKYKNIDYFNMEFSTGWIDQIKKSDIHYSGNSYCNGKRLGCKSNPNIPYKNGNNNMESVYLSKTSSTFAIFGGTLGCFGEYKEIFLDQMNTKMEKGDYLLISVFEKPQNKEDIPDIISKYNNEPSKKFVFSFFEKIGISSNCMEYMVEYNNDKIEVFVLINNTKGEGCVISAYGEKAFIKNGTKIKAHESERFDEESFKELLKKTPGLVLKDNIENKNPGPVIYVVGKE